MSDQYYPWFSGDYLRDTGDLSLLEHGAYRVLLDHYYSQEGLTSDRNRLYRISRAFSEDERQAIDTVVERYFKDNGNGRIINRKAEEVIKERKAFIAEQSRKGKLSAEKRWGKKDEESITAVTTAVVTERVTEAQPDCNLPSPSPSKRDKSLFVDTSNEVRLSESLFEKIRANNPQTKSPNIQAWATQIDLMLRIDKRNPDNIQAVIDWCQEDDFWKQNILSTKKLREKFDQLWVKMTTIPKRKNKSQMLEDGPGWGMTFQETKLEPISYDDFTRKDLIHK